MLFFEDSHPDMRADGRARPLHIQKILCLYVPQLLHPLCFGKGHAGLSLKGRSLLRGRFLSKCNLQLVPQYVLAAPRVAATAGLLNGVRSRSLEVAEAGEDGAVGAGGGLVGGG